MMPGKVTCKGLYDSIPNLARLEQTTYSQSVFIKCFQLRQSVLRFFEKTGIRNGGSGHGCKGFKQFQVIRAEGSFCACTPDAQDANCMVALFERRKHDGFLLFSWCAGHLYSARVILHLIDDFSF